MICSALGLPIGHSIFRRSLFFFFHFFFSTYIWGIKTTSEIILEYLTLAIYRPTRRSNTYNFFFFFEENLPLILLMNENRNVYISIRSINLTKKKRPIRSIFLKEKKQNKQIFVVGNDILVCQFHYMPFTMQFFFFLFFTVV